CRSPAERGGGAQRRALTAASTAPFCQARWPSPRLRVRCTSDPDPTDAAAHIADLQTRSHEERGVVVVHKPRRSAARWTCHAPSSATRKPWCERPPTEQARGHPARATPGSFSHHGLFPIIDAVAQRRAAESAALGVSSAPRNCFVPRRMATLKAFVRRIAERGC